MERIFTTPDLGAAVRRARRRRGLSQIQLADHANVARSAVQKLERGRGTVRLETALKLLHMLSLDLAIASRSTGHDPQEGADAR
ncbi:MAG: helix-turn-helix domain-containing protein [Chloroflexota bacterium]